MRRQERGDDDGRRRRRRPRAADVGRRARLRGLLRIASEQVPGRAQGLPVVGPGDPRRALAALRGGRAAARRDAREPRARPRRRKYSKALRPAAARRDGRRRTAARHGARDAVDHGAEAQGRRARGRRRFVTNGVAARGAAPAEEDYNKAPRGPAGEVVRRPRGRGPGGLELPCRRGHRLPAVFDALSFGVPAAGGPRLRAGLVF